MKSRFTTILLAALTIALGTTVQANPPLVVTWPDPPASPVHMEGPFHLGIGAELRAEWRLAQGYYAMPVQENGQWWVAYYPLFPAPPLPRHGWWRVGVNSCPECSATSDTFAPTNP